MQQWLKFVRLGWRDRQLLVRTFALLGLVRLGLWLLPFLTLQGLLDRISRPSPSFEKTNPRELDKIVWAVNQSSRYTPGGAKCLARALTTGTIMRRHGYSPQLKIGVAKGDRGQFEAHAWIEDRGRVVVGRLNDLSRFTPMPSLEGDR
ncbi:lasso peptide biosynthesis B2 protein [Oscillatoriales cyanobacterium LEGE 11467]|uniref:Lasso peptide biosynthesis B2 protein n=1 Tax=Zarconia navalis LEGE 11467 TaxID=1828826 RepID=A0A928VX94_9CYAN|nr:lasso peptide biosynthesis B2 protein [Zarconia navalis]MBE9041279.1 lasso peptide biosynthesis B2 protein [Zarconia navalis LEGE 11467]